jgi:hypothetical protein
MSWVAASIGGRRTLIGLVGPVARPLLRFVFAVQRRIEKRGRYADPWALIEQKYGRDVLAPTDF